MHLISLIGRLIFFCLLVFTAQRATAQYISLNDTEARRLSDSIRTNPAVRMLYNRFKQTADRALEEDPRPIEKIRSQGLLAGDPLKDASLKAVEDVDKMYALALVYRIENKEAYLVQLGRYLLAWAENNHATGDPIDETKLENAFVAYDLVRDQLKAGNRDKIDGWLKEIAVAESGSIYATGTRSTALNNWNSHRVKIIMMIATVLKDRRLGRDAESELKKQLEKNLLPDGTTFDFHERDALHYHIYSLEPLLKALIALQRWQGIDYFYKQTSTGASVKQSVDFLVPFVTGEKTHVEFAGSKVAFDSARANNGEKGYVPAAFVPSKGIIVLALAAWFEPGYKNLILNSPGRAGYRDWQLTLNSVIRK